MRSIAGRRKGSGYPIDDGRRAFSLALGGVLPLLVWWAGWFPGFVDADALVQWSEIDAMQFTNAAPAFHTITLWILSIGGSAPGLPPLVQALAFGVILAVTAARLTRLGVPWQAAGGLGLVAGWLPSVGSAAVTASPQSAQMVASLWVFAELLSVARRGRDALVDRILVVRLGVALGLVSLTSHTGVVVAVIVGVVLFVLVRDDPMLVVPGAVAAVTLVLTVQVGLFGVLDVDRRIRPIGEAYAPEVAAVVQHHPERLEPADLRLVIAVAPLEVWESAYRCEDGAALLADPGFDTSVIREDPSAYRGLLMRATLAAPETVLGHRACAAAFVFVPPGPAAQSYATVSPEIPPNDLGLERRPLVGAAHSLTDALLRGSEGPIGLMVTWRPGLVLWLGTGAFVAAAWRGRLRLLLPALVVISQVLVAAATVRSAVFADASAVFVLALVSIPLWWTALRSRPLDMP